MSFHRQIALMMQAEAAPPPVGNLVFSANTYDPITFEMLGVDIGTGVLADGRAFQIDTADFEGIYKTFSAGEPAWSGGRVTGPAGSRVVYADNGSGVLLDPLPRLVHAPQATNVVRYSNDLTKWDVTTAPTTTTFNQIGLRGEPNTATLVNKDTTDLRYSSTEVNTESTGRDFVVRFFIRKEAMDGDYPSIKVSTGSAGGDRTTFAINKDTGAYSTILDVNSPVTYVSSEIVGNEVVFTVGGNSGTTSLLYVAVYGALSKDMVTQDTTAIGNMTIKNSEIYLDMLGENVKSFPPLINGTGASLTRDSCDLKFDIANHDNTQGAWMVEAEVLAPVSAAMALLGFRSASPSIINPRDGNTAVRSTNDAFFTEITGLDVTLAKKFAVAYDAAADKMVLVVDGFDSTVVSYSAFLVSSDIRLAYNSEEAIRFGPIMRHDAPYDQAKQIIDSWMAE